MGQKVNPISMRLQVNKNWRSKWFAGKKEYAAFLSQDINVRKEIEAKFDTRAVINLIEIERSPNLVTVTIHTSKAGVVIGRGGVGAQEIKALCERMFKTQVRVNIEEVKRCSVGWRERVSRKSRSTICGSASPASAFARRAR